MNNKIPKSNELDIEKNKDNEIIIKLYKKYLNRYPDRHGLEFYSGELKKKGIDYVISKIKNSEEYKDIINKKSKDIIIKKFKNFIEYFIEIYKNDNNNNNYNNVLNFIDNLDNGLKEILNIKKIYEIYIENFNRIPDTKGLNNYLKLIKLHDEDYVTKQIRESNEYKNNFRKYKLSIVLLCFNKLNYTKKCIESVLSNTFEKNYQLIIVNNNSTDGTRKYLDKLVNENNNIRTINNKTNLGFAKGMNIGIKNCYSDYVILLNNDTVVSKDWDKSLVNLLINNRKICAVTPITNNSGNESRFSIHHNTPDEYFTKYSKIKNKLITHFKTNSLALYCGAFRLKDLQILNYLDENYLNGWEDDDLFEKIKELNREVVISLNSCVYHFGNITVGKDAYDDINNKNKIYFEKKWNKKWRSHHVSNPLITDGKIEIKYQKDYFKFNNYYINLKLKK